MQSLKTLLMSTAVGGVLRAEFLLCACCLAACAVRGAGLPDDVARQIGERLPAAFVPIPASGAGE
jgi:hypothetical protein